MREISSASFSNRFPSPLATVLAALACAWAPGCGGGDVAGNEAPRSTCSTEVDCAEGLVCDPARRVCVECAADGDCGEDEVCDANRCAPDSSCQSDGDCAPNVCDPDSERCVACVEDEHCDNDEECRGNECLKTCGSEDECSGARPFCDEEAGVCVECTEAAPCEGSESCISGVCEPACEGDGCEDPGSGGAGGGAGHGPGGTGGVSSETGGVEHPGGNGAGGSSGGNAAGGDSGRGGAPGGSGGATGGGGTGDGGDGGTPGGSGGEGGVLGGAGGTGGTSGSGGSGSGGTGGSGGIGGDVSIVMVNGWVSASSNVGRIQGSFSTVADEYSTVLPATYEGEDSPVCANGTVARVVDDLWEETWGAVITLNLNQADPSSSPLAYDASAYGVAGFRFEITGATVPTGLRFTAYADGYEYCREIAAGSNTVRFTDLHSQCWDGPTGWGPSPDPTALSRVLWHVAATDEEQRPFAFCVEEIELILE